MSHPEHEGMVLVARWEGGEGYDWCQEDLWYQSSTDKYYLYWDSGCSCFFPYDFYQGVADMQEIHDLGHLMRALDSMNGRDKGKFLSEYMEFESTKDKRVWR